MKKKGSYQTELRQFHDISKVLWEESAHLSRIVLRVRAGSRAARKISIPSVPQSSGGRSSFLYPSGSMWLNLIER
jgi:hypothetical protein